MMMVQMRVEEGEVAEKKGGRREMEEEGKGKKRKKQGGERSEAEPEGTGMRGPAQDLGEADKSASESWSCGCRAREPGRALRHPIGRGIGWGQAPLGIA